MNYTARITTRNPSAFMIMVDRSGSMSETVSWDGNLVSASQAVASAINNMIAEVIARCKGDDSPRHYFDIGVLGYSGDQIYSLLPTTSSSWFLTPAELQGCVRYTKTVQKQRIMPDSRKVITSTLEKVWVESGAEYRTPMAAAFGKIHTLMSAWCDSHRDSFPPIVINITDGEATDAEPERIIKLAQKLQGLSTDNGNLLLLNIHICNNGDQCTIFPISHLELPEGRNAKLLYDISSLMPEMFEKEINYIKGLDSQKLFKGMAYNASIVDLIKMLNIGSSSINMIL